MSIESGAQCNERNGLALSSLTPALSEGGKERERSLGLAIGYLRQEGCIEIVANFDNCVSSFFNVRTWMIFSFFILKILVKFWLKITRFAGGMEIGCCARISAGRFRLNFTPLLIWIHQLIYNKVLKEFQFKKLTSYKKYEYFPSGIHLMVILWDDEILKD